MRLGMIEVTDHAVVRWLERVRGIDISSVRREIAGLCGPAAMVGAATVKVSGVKFHIVGNRVCTVVRTKGDDPRHARVLDPKRSRTSEKKRWQRMLP